MGVYKPPGSTRSHVGWAIAAAIGFGGLIAGGIWLARYDPVGDQIAMRQLFVEYDDAGQVIIDAKADMTSTNPILTKADLDRATARRRKLDEESRKRFGCDAIELFKKLDAENRKIVVESQHLNQARIDNLLR